MEASHSFIITSLSFVHRVSLFYKRECPRRHDSAPVATMSHTLTTPTKPTASATNPRPAEKVRCKCNHLAKRLTSRSEKNPGRVFYQCYKGRDDPETCKFFGTSRLGTVLIPY